MGCGGESTCARRRVASCKADRVLITGSGAGTPVYQAVRCLLCMVVGKGRQAAGGGVISVHAAIAGSPATLPPCT